MALLEMTSVVLGYVEISYNDFTGWAVPFRPSPVVANVIIGASAELLGVLKPVLVFITWVRALADRSRGSSREGGSRRNARLGFSGFDGTSN